MAFSVSSILAHKYTLYALVAVSALQLYGFYAVSDVQCLSLFLVVALAARVFDKRNTVALLAGLVATNFLFAGKCVREGFAGEEEEETEDEEVDVTEGMRCEGHCKDGKCPDGEPCE